ncbi:hypothetical protein MTO96_005737 [Rhipicephalus appendiculatus]
MSPMVAAGASSEVTWYSGGREKTQLRIPTAAVRPATTARERGPLMRCQHQPRHIFLAKATSPQGSAPNSPLAQRREMVAASAAMPRRSNSAEKLLSRQHTFCPKTVIKTETCGPCGKRIKFYKTLFRCSRCNAICHPECKHQVPLPCIPAVATPKRSGAGSHRGTLISDHAPSTAPMVPALVVHCIQEVERRGLDCVGIYRVSGSERESLDEPLEAQSKEDLTSTLYIYTAASQLIYIISANFSDLSSCNLLIAS